MSEMVNDKPEGRAQWQVEPKVNFPELRMLKKQSPRLLNKANEPGLIRFSAMLCYLSMWGWNKDEEYLRNSIFIPFSFPPGYHP